MGLLCLAENQESVDALFAVKEICAGFSEPTIADHIITLHITDQKLYNNFPLVLKAQIRADSKVVQHHAKIVKFLVYLADWLSVKYKVEHQV